ncbi:MAG: SMP-30/gluconolactonase/LRE family protein [Fuerstiella sp.]
MVMTTECKVLLHPESAALRFLPEGPYSLPQGGLSWVGIQHGAASSVGSVNILDVASGNNVSHELPGRPGFAFPTSTPGVFIAGVERELGLFDTRSGQWTVLCDGVDSSVENTIINDGVIYHDNLIFGCKELEFKTRKAGLYLYRGRDRQLIKLRDDQICSNGKAVTAGIDDRLHLVDIDSPSKQITIAALDIDAGTLGEQSVIVDLSAEEVFPDGMLVTPNGQSLIVALYDPADPAFGVARQYGLASGELEAVWTCPGSPRVTCPQLFSIEGAVHLVLTTAVEHMEADQQARHPNAGCLFMGTTSFHSIGDQPVFPISG